MAETADTGATPDQTSQPGSTQPQGTPRGGAGNGQRSTQQARGGKPNGRDTRTPKDPRFNDRVKRLAQDISDREMRRVAKAFGLEKFDKKALETKLADLEKSREDGLSVADRLDKRLTELQAENARLQGDLSRLKGDLSKARRDRDRALRDKEDLSAEFEVRQAAASAGIVEDPDYAIELFKRHVRDNKDYDASPADFFGSLKAEKKYRHLFREEEVQAGAQPPRPPQGGQEGERPPPSRIPPQGPPPPATGKGTDLKVDVLETDENGKPKMSARDFKKYASQQYGYAGG